MNKSVASVPTSTTSNPTRLCFSLYFYGAIHPSKADKAHSAKNSHEKLLKMNKPVTPIKHQGRPTKIESAMGPSIPAI